MTYSTCGGSVVSKSIASVGLHLVEFSNSKRIDYEVRVDKANSADDAPYDTSSLVLILWQMLVLIFILAREKLCEIDRKCQ